MGNTKKKKTDEAIETTEVTTETEVVETKKDKDAEKEAKEAAKVEKKIDKAISKQTKEEKKADEKAAKKMLKEALGIDEIVEPVEISETKTVIADFLNVRRSPDASTDQNVIKIIRKGTPVNVTAHFDGVWSKIDFEGIDAYVMSKFIN